MDNSKVWRVNSKVNGGLFTAMCSSEGAAGVFGADVIVGEMAQLR